MSSLRKWQSDCVDAALEHYAKFPHFFCQATPGAGKTRMAAEVARRLLLSDKIDLILCFAPSCQTVEGFRGTFESHLGLRFDGRIGAVGAVSTYQGMDYQDQSFWALLDQYRVFAVFDEIHHCAGAELSLGNTWGQLIIERVQGRATYTLALSGTPWRSDERSIVLARYSNPDGRILCDFKYGLKAAINDLVCRSPRIVLIDNGAVKVTTRSGKSSTVNTYSSIAELLGDSPVTFEYLLSQRELVSQILELGCRKLDEIRLETLDAGGLIVAASIRHAHLIADELSRLGESCQVVTNQTPDAQEAIDEFRIGTGRWIVAVGMISEGTDIPRLQVCCYLSRIRTELHYRQVLGRILRRIGPQDAMAWLYVLAEPSLKAFSERLSLDLPEDLAVIHHVHRGRIEVELTPEYCGFECLEDQATISVSSPLPTTAARDVGVEWSTIEDSCSLHFLPTFRTELLEIY
ncbi:MULTISPECIES: DEAD/DEAH box helicase [Pseudomonas]|uniref:DEAD/DEAH box helicase family protein n=1 Tax=Pseudomonas sp. Hg7Tf TaxID=3236988 RepID=A0AB39HU84_9PSED|nr:MULTISPECIES: DEAD/DEAH box helicase family protein [Pseudomonas]MDH2559860.1 DEAD/DEAH box helicase family protein [Pseudomonas sp. Hg5Tf]MDN7142209.1 DEAD/DEAH box helicase family protein [Pseudomonas sp. JQ170]WRO76887.1 DEAD/DEAH box helicase family protein [Pseudomonas sp. 170C]